MLARVPVYLVALALTVCFVSPSEAKKPRRSKAKVHVVAKGEILGTIAKQYGLNVADIRAANDLESDVIRVGQKLTLPRATKRQRQRLKSRTEGKARVVRHQVMPGEFLGGIAKRYGTSVKAIQQRNKLKHSRIRPGQTLLVDANVPTRERREFVYTIEAGDTLSSIAKRYGMKVKQIAQMNPRMKPRRLRIGDSLKLTKDGPAVRSETKGKASAGRLVNGEQLPAGPGYYRRTPRKSWGTNETITQLLRVIGEVRRKHPKAHDVTLEHLSAKHGGPLKPHKSHQSGRDVDMGMYFKKQPKEGPKRFLNFTKYPLDFEASWTLLTALTDDNERDTRVQYIFLDYKAQEKIYTWARKHKKASKKLLKYMFQYPRGRRAMRGKIRHVKGHRGHLHVRFKCPDSDDSCV